jgi:hypothetical protein
MGVSNQHACLSEKLGWTHSANPKPSASLASSHSSAQFTIEMPVPIAAYGKNRVLASKVTAVFEASALACKSVSPCPLSVVMLFNRCASRHLQRA